MHFVNVVKCNFPLHILYTAPAHYTDNALVPTLRSKTQLWAILAIEDHILRLKEDITVDSLSNTVIGLNTTEAYVALRSEVDEGTRNHGSIPIDVDSEIR